jgi:hypothetical protein
MFGGISNGTSVVSGSAVGEGEEASYRDQGPDPDAEQRARQHDHEERLHERQV